MNKAVIAVCILAAACASSSSRSGDDKDVISATTGDWAADLNPRNNSGVQGTAKLQSAVVGAGVNISISGAAPGALHPWHVHFGSCANSGAIVGSAGSYPVLAVGSGGSASANATISSSLTEGNAYSVNVHRSPTDLGTIVACGELKN